MRYNLKFRKLILYGLTGPHSIKKSKQIYGQKILKKRLSLIVRVNVVLNRINNPSIMPSTDVIQLTLTLKMTTAQVVKTSVTVNNNSPIQDYVHPNDQTQPFEMPPGFKPFTKDFK